jgi:uncharacterized protein with ParB-like and HNH nuclease domain
MSSGSEEIIIFKPDAKTIKKVFGDSDSYYYVPDYQRPYSWGDEQIEQMWDDINSAMKAGDKNYFLGPMILIRTPNGFEIVDGQQRLTTLTILFCVIRDLYLEKLKERDKELANRIKDSIKSLVDDKYRLRLITQLNYQNEFEQEILKGVNFSKVLRTQKEKRENSFLNAALIFKEKLEDLKKEGGIDSILNFVRYLLENVVVITIVCSNQEYAVRLFQVLNTRGLDLAPADLIKSSLYKRLDETKKEQFNCTWREVEMLSKQMGESLDNLFTYYEYYLLARNPKGSLYEELEEQFGKKDPNEVIYKFKKFVECFSEISDSQDKVIYSFWYLPNQVFWKAIVTTACMENYVELQELCKELRRLYYSYWIAGYTTSKIKQLSFNLISWIKEKKSLSEIKEEINKKMKEDRVLERMKENLEDNVYQYSWLKPLLVLIEYQQIEDSSMVSYIDLNKNIHVDHILPQEWEKIDYWRERWNKEKANNWLHKLGNLTLLSGRKNINASNKSFPEKKKIYKGKGIDGITPFQISQMIIENDDWTENDVKKRHEWMIKQIEKILNIPLSKE